MNHPSIAAAALFCLVLAPEYALLADDGGGDPTFDTDGVRLVDWAGLQSLAAAVVATDDASLYVGGRARGGDGSFDGAVVKLTPGGALDTSWGSFGLRRVPIDAAESAEDRLAALFELSDHSLLLAGFSVVDDFTGIENPAIAKLTPGGDLDPTFGDGGITDFGMPWATDEYFWAGAVHQLDGKALYFGYCLDCPDNPVLARPMLLRITTAGATDSGFSGNGWEVPISGPWSTVIPMDVAFDALGRILVLGWKSGQVSITRLSGGGILDTTFGGGDGNEPIAIPAGHSSPYRLAVDPESGAMLVSMGFTSGPNSGFAGLMRLTATGAVDATYAGDGLAELVFDAGLVVRSLVLQSDGKLAGGGQIASTAPGGDLDFCLFRLLANGVLDDSFHGNGVRRVEFGETPDGVDYAYATTLSGGRLVAVGRATADGINNFAVSRSTSDLIFADGFERGSPASWPGY